MIMPSPPPVELDRFSIFLDPDTSITVILQNAERPKTQIVLELHGPISLEQKHQTLIDPIYFQSLQDQNRVHAYIQTLAQTLRQSIPKSVEGKPLFAGDWVTIVKEGATQNAQSVVKAKGKSWVELVNGARYYPHELIHTTDPDCSHHHNPKKRSICFFFNHREKEIPIGLRNYRTIEYQSFHWTTIDILNPDKAAIALIETIDSNSATATPHQRFWRWYKGCLYLNETLENTAFPKAGHPYSIPEPDYRAARQTLAYQPGSFDQIEPPEIPGRSNQSRDERIKDIETWAKRRFILDGQMWVKTSNEPRYRIETDHLKQLIRIRTQYAYDCHINPRKYFRLDELPALEAEVEGLKREDSDLKIQYRIEWDCKFEILIPESLQLQPQEDSKTEEEQQFLKRYKQFRTNDLHRNLRSNPQETIRALQMALAETIPLVEPFKDRWSQWGENNQRQHLFLWNIPADQIERILTLI